MFETPDEDINELRDAVLEYIDVLGDRILSETQVIAVLPPDPERFAAVNLHPSARQAHHVAGEAVAVVLKRAIIEDIRLGNLTFSADGGEIGIPSEVQHTTSDADRAFVWFAGIRASGLWLCWYGDEEIDAAMNDTWVGNTLPTRDGIADQYASRVDELAERFGSSSTEFAWEGMWDKQLHPFDFAVAEVAEMLINGQPVTHEDVEAAVDRCRCG
jgi:hypothetical protein